MNLKKIENILIKKGQKVKSKAFVKILFYKVKSKVKKENFAHYFFSNSQIILKPLAKNNVKSNKQNEKIKPVFKVKQSKNFMEIYKNKSYIFKKKIHFFYYFQQINQRHIKAVVLKKKILKNTV